MERTLIVAKPSEENLLRDIDEFTRASEYTDQANQRFSQKIPECPIIAYHKNYADLSEETDFDYRMKTGEYSGFEYFVFQKSPVIRLNKRDMRSLLMTNGFVVRQIPDELFLPGIEVVMLESPHRDDLESSMETFRNLYRESKWDYIQMEFSDIEYDRNTALNRLKDNKRVDLMSHGMILNPYNMVDFISD